MLSSDQSGRSIFLQKLVQKPQNSSWCVQPEASMANSDMGETEFEEAALRGLGNGYRLVASNGLTVY